jgi:hypothetical protein
LAPPKSELVLAGVAMLMSVTVGCSGTQEPGSPTPATSSAVASTPADGARPFDLPLDAVQPCDLFTDSVRQQFQLQGEPDTNTDVAGRPDCQLRSADGGGYIVIAEHREGMERFEGIPTDLGTVRRLTIGEFPAAELRDVNQPFACLVGIDVADGQYLGVYASDTPRGGTQDEICRHAVTFAEAVLGSLRQHHGR